MSPLLTDDFTEKLNVTWAIHKFSCNFNGIIEALIYRSKKKKKCAIDTDFALIITSDMKIKISHFADMEPIATVKCQEDKWALIISEVNRTDKGMKLFDQNRMHA